MRGIASAEKQASQPRSLMQRLALVVNGNIGSGSSEPEGTERPGCDRNPVVYFGLGVAASGMIGVVALLGLLRLAPDQGSTLGDLSTQAVAALAPWPIAPSTPPAVAVRETHPAHAFDMVISRGERASAPFGLRLTGTDEADVEVLLRDVPATALLSRGVRRDEGTWAVRPADLAALHLSLSDGAPDAFEVRIDVVTPANVAAASTVARVRLIDGPNDAGPRVAATEPPSDAMMRGNPAATAGGIDPPFQMQRMVASRRPGAAGEDKAARTPAPQRAATAVEATARMPQAAPQPRHWPEGASGLGAVPRESERQVWWKMPAPTWSPF